MALRFNNAEITQVYFNEVEKMTLQYNGTGYFGKRFSLTKSTSTGVTLTVSRTNSPNQRAATGNVATGNTIYYGDVITITCTTSSGYTNAKLYVNTGSGAVLRTSPYTFTVTGDVTFYGTATVASEWQTVWSGTQKFTSAGSFAVPGLADGGSVQVTAHATFIDYYYDAINNQGYEGSSYEGSINRAVLPVSIFGSESSITLTRNGGSIGFTFNVNQETAKGYTIYEIPVELTITEVRRKA